ncbi:MAG TPA: hypothetical protein VN765_11495 [Candidatus Acidoferrum sp.]|nr:hypothetical protein [Candidatus Acidoferrum sp.]
MISIIVILLVLLLPARVGHGPSWGTMCRGNLRQLQLAWAMYAGDNHDKLAQNIASNIGGGHYATTANQAGCQPGQPYASWVLGDANQHDPGFITNGLLYSYVNRLSVYKCPADVKTNSLLQPTLRSYSMNAWMAGNPAWSSGYVNFMTGAAINKSMPSSLALVFVEENPATINDGYWVQSPGSPTTWLDSPAQYHGGGCNLSFADGHVGFRKWTDKYILTGSSAQFASDPASGDLAWVQARCTVKAPSSAHD